ncbi:MAG: hypothetical protein SGILL_008567 [Bacillariaceae sp.]
MCLFFSGPLKLNVRTDEATNGLIQDQVQDSIHPLLSITTLLLFLWMGLATNQPAFALDAPISASTLVTAEPESSLSLMQQQEQLLMKSLRPATEDRPQIPLPTMESDLADGQQVTKPSSSKYYQNMESSSGNPQLIQTLLSLASPRTTRPYGTDILTIKVWSGPPPNYKGESVTKNSAAGSVLLGGAKLPLAVVGGGGFPLRITLGPQNALDASQWKQYTQSSPQDLWLETGVCRSIQTEEEVGPGVATRANSNPASTSRLCAADSKPVLEAYAVSKWIVLPSSSSQEDTNAGQMGVRAPSTLQLR